MATTTQSGLAEAGHADYYTAMFSFLKRLFAKKPGNQPPIEAETSLAIDFAQTAPAWFSLGGDERYASSLRQSSLLLELFKKNLFAWSEATAIVAGDFYMEASFRFGPTTTQSLSPPGDQVAVTASALPANPLPASAPVRNNASAGFIFRMSADDTFMYLLVGSNGALRLEMVFNGEPATVCAWTECPWLDAALPINLQLIARGGYFLCLANGRFALEASDDRLSSGHWAFAAQNYDTWDALSCRLERFKLETGAMAIERVYLELAKKQTADPEQRRRLAATYMGMRKWPAAWQQLVKLGERDTLTAGDHFQLAECYLHEELLQDAETSLRRCLALEPDHRDANEELFNLLYLQNRYDQLKAGLLASPTLVGNARQQNLLGHACFNLGDWVGAAAAYLAAAGLDPAMPIYSLNAARSLDRAGQAAEAAASWLQAARGFLAQSAGDDAAECLSQLRRLGYDKYELATMEARLAWEQADYDKVEKLLAPIVKKQKGDAVACHLYGLLQANLGKRQDALAWFDRARQLAPDNPSCQLKYCEQLYLTGADCRTALAEALGLCPTDGWLNNLAGIIALRNGDQSSAVASFRQAASALPEAEEPAINLATALAGSGDLDGGLATLAAVRPSAATANAAGNLSVGAGRLDEAVLAYQAAGRLAATDPTIPARRLAEYHTNLGAVYLEQERWADAGEALRHALEIDSDVRSLMLMGDVWLETGEFVRAETAWKTALQQQPDAVDVLVRLAGSYCRRGKYDEAASLADRLAVLQPEKERELRARIHQATTEQLACLSCGREWSVPRGLPNVPRLQLRGELPDNAPAGACPDCQAIYCVACRKPDLDDGRFTCARCGSHLKLNDDRVRYLVVNIVREAAADAGLEPAALPESPKLSEPVGN